MRRAQDELGVSERRACRALRQHRSVQRYESTLPARDKRLIAKVRRVAVENKRYGYRRIGQELRRQGFEVNSKRIYRLCRQEGLIIRPQRRKAARLARGDGTNSITRKRPEFPNHVWTYDFVQDQTNDSRRLKMLTVLDEYTRTRLAIEVGRNIGAAKVRKVLLRLTLTHGFPGHIRSDNGGEFIANMVKDWLKEAGVNTLFIDPASPWQNAYIESFNGRLRDEFLNQEVFSSLQEARTLAEDWRAHYNYARPHSSLGYLTPTEFRAQWLERKAS